MVVEQSVLCQPNRLSHSGEIDPAAPAHIADEIPSTAVSHIIQYLEDHDACALKRRFAVADFGIGHNMST